MEQKSAPALSCSHSLSHAARHIDESQLLNGPVTAHGPHGPVIGHVAICRRVIGSSTSTRTMATLAAGKHRRPRCVYSIATAATGKYCGSVGWKSQLLPIECLRTGSVKSYCHHHLSTTVSVQELSDGTIGKRRLIRKGLSPPQSSSL